MRPPAEHQSALRAPLNHVLATQANVRILRVLSSTTVALGKTEVARRAQLADTGVRRAIDDLVDLGIVEALGTGSRRPVRLRREHPLAPALEALFAAESARFDALLDGLRAAVGRVEPPPQAAWLKGPMASGLDVPGDSVVLAVLTSADELTATVKRLNEELADLSQMQDVTIEVRGMAVADLVTLVDEDKAELLGARPLVGPAPEAFLEERPTTRRGRVRSHADLDRRALAVGRVIADGLSDDPSLVERARKYTARRLAEASPGGEQELREWDRILRTMSIPRLQRFLVDTGELATRLRQSLPFLPVLTEEERHEILEEVEA